ncbi:hypothetical protein QR680_008724 [Steinernema hermaphroditum]|uniref:Uncharacterized protein n=1 Tax=Steinernema hermaphroditum TaxID=289476 RepID=A0AA39IJM2_9BILA|nr:hypothetical protein QR680_008724 [Steinernema hermaphroditum]
MNDVAVVFIEEVIRLLDNKAIQNAARLDGPFGFFGALFCRERFEYRLGFAALGAFNSVTRRPMDRVQARFCSQITLNGNFFERGAIRSIAKAQLYAKEFQLRIAHSNWHPELLKVVDRLSVSTCAFFMCIDGKVIEMIKKGKVRNIIFPTIMTEEVRKNLPHILQPELEQIIVYMHCPDILKWVTEFVNKHTTELRGKSIKFVCRHEKDMIELKQFIEYDEWKGSFENGLFTFR